MPSGLNIKDGVYIEEPVRMRVDLPVIPDGGFNFDRRYGWRKQNRQRLAYIEHDGVRRHGNGLCEVAL
jgi:hypothetical protein